MKTSIAFLALIIAVIGLSILFRSADRPATLPAEGLPWQIESLAHGESRVFGLTLARSTLGDARARFGTEVEIAVIAAPGEPGSLEAYYGNVHAGVILGKMILLAAVNTETVALFRQRAVKSEYMDGVTKKFSLHRDDLERAWRAPIASITFIPATSLDEATILTRFGAPTERIRLNAQTEHFLYPEKGLDLMFNSKGKEVLQYVAPRDFARLRDPLLRASSGAVRPPSMVAGSISTRRPCGAAPWAC